MAKKNSQAMQQMVKGGVSGPGHAQGNGGATGTGGRGNYRGGSTGTTKATTQLGKRTAGGGSARDRDGDGF